MAPNDFPYMAKKLPWHATVLHSHQTYIQAYLLLWFHEKLMQNKPNILQRSWGKHAISSNCSSLPFHVFWSFNTQPIFLHLWSIKFHLNPTKLNYFTNFLGLQPIFISTCIMALTWCPVCSSLVYELLSGCDLPLFIPSTYQRA